MKIEIDLAVCGFCKFFQIETKDGLDFLEEPFCTKTGDIVEDSHTCALFQIDKERLKTIKDDFKCCKWVIK